MSGLKAGMWVDPPSGWRFGFPKIFTPNDGESLEVWLLRNGVPGKIVALGHVRYWEAEAVTARRDMELTPHSLHT